MLTPFTYWRITYFMIPVLFVPIFMGGSTTLGEIGENGVAPNKVKTREML